MPEETFLIAHLVRGQPAFDIAGKMECPHCKGVSASGGTPNFEGIHDCAQCENTGFWWIIPTFGHRAYPYWFHPVKGLYLFDNDSHYNMLDWGVVPGFGPLDPPQVRDFYTAAERSALKTKATTGGLDLLKELGL